MRRSHTISVSIDRSYDDVYAYLSKPSNYGHWAAVDTGTFRPLANGDWQANTPFGFRYFRFTPPNAFGVLDHAIFEPGQAVWYNPMRVVPNELGSEVSFTFFRRDGMDDAQFTSAVEWITTDFLALKSLLEAQRRP
ncbi:SRPBCC family protein [Devosia lacusdianchii]|uniref:SRPBCC family protein n=1 Tax=Devosia lacusdianchii TaxID=2917991 RepID=UPI001F0535E2|nr:SRPBCC family protein [Devosia sp. JXJ CY 41]